MEENSFSTGHQSVNVYGLPEKCYEIRSEDTAVDIQIHRNVSKMVQNKNEITEKLNDGLHDVNHSEELEFLWINENVKICPFDKVQMNYQAIPVKKKDGSLKKLNMLVCPTCKGKFLVDGCVPDSVNLSEYCVLGKRLNSQNVLDSPIKKSENSTAKYVYSSKYGAGEIIKRFKQDKETRIVVRFKSREVTYNEEIAFKNETLVKK